MGGKNKKKFKTSNNKALSTAKRQELLDKMKNKKKRFQFVRSSGTGSTQEKHLLSRNKDFDENMMEDMQTELKGVNGSKAKKYMKNMMSGLNPVELDQMSKQVKGLGLSNSETMENMINHEKKVKINKEQSIIEEKVKDESNPLIYKPFYELTNDEKQARKIANTNSDGKKKKKKKKFKKIDINIPKPHEMANVSLAKDNNNQNTKPATVTSANYSADGIKEMFHTSNTTQTALNYEYINEKKRLSNLSNFKTNNRNNAMKLFIMEHSHEDNVTLKTILSSCTLDLPCSIIVPGSRICPPIGDIPKNIQEHLAENLTETMIVKNNVYDMKEGDIYKSKNCVKECRGFITRFEKIRRWLKSLENEVIPIEWFIEQMHTIGVFESISQPHHFYTHGREYLTKDEVSVAEIPLFRIDFIKTY